MAGAEPRLDPLCGDGAVLQAGMRVSLRGADPVDERVTVQLEGQAISTVARDGRWSVELAPLAPGGPFPLILNGVAAVRVYVGEVWLCSGQSNMEWPLSETVGSAKALAEAADPRLRLFVVAHRTADSPQDALSHDERWVASDAESAARFSAVGWYFGRRLRRALKMPVGLIESAWGGTVAEAWTSAEALAGPFPAFAEEYRVALEQYPRDMDAWRQATKGWEAAHSSATPPPTPWDPRLLPNFASHLYNGMIAPLLETAIRGVIWYQGESNAMRSEQYRTLFPLLIADWRARWGRSDLPFLFVQLAPWRVEGQPPGTDWAALREAQRETAARVAGTAMVVTTDVGDPRDIHPRRKGPVGDRLARAALALVYRRRIAWRGPSLQRARRSGHAVVLHFADGAGLRTSDGRPPRGFTLCGADGVFHVAAAVISNGTVRVATEQVPRPIEVRYGWSDCPDVNLVNRAGLPASPFRATVSR
jgi:sialate O-acetylesterase